MTLHVHRFAVRSAAILTLLLCASPVWARTQADIICHDRVQCATGSSSACPSGITCRDLTTTATALRGACDSLGVEVGHLCLTDADVTCAASPDCLNRDDAATGVAPTGAATASAPFVPLTPNLGVDIPGLTLGGASRQGEDVTVPFLAQYIAGVYRYAVQVAVIAAIVMTVYGGFRYLVGSTFNDVKRGKEIIMDAVLGLLILLGGYTILNTINPDTLSLNAIQLSLVRTTVMPADVPDADDESATPIPASEHAVPPSPAPTPPAAAPGTGPGGAGRVSGSSGGVSFINFNYKPDSQTNDGTAGHWGFGANMARLTFPSRLSEQRVDVHAYIFIHGWNNGHSTVASASYIRLLTQALQEVAGTKNIVILTPHFMAGTQGHAIDATHPTATGNGGYAFMDRFSLSTFYQTAQEALRANTETANFHIVDVVVGGHSAATCSLTQLGQAARRPVPGQIGVVAYDGCAGGTLTRVNFTPSSGALYLNPDLAGMGASRFQTVRDQWGLAAVACPAFVEARVNCYKNPSSNWWSFETRFNHVQSVYHMTRYMFQAFYP